MFRIIVDWLGRLAVNAGRFIFRRLIVPFESVLPSRVIDFFSILGPRPIIRSFSLLGHVPCGQANLETGLRLSYDVDPAGATINSIEIFRIYTRGAPPFVEPPPPAPTPANRLPSGEYFESVFRIGPVSSTDFIRMVQDPGLRVGAHWGHSVYYHQYRIVVQTSDSSVSQSIDVNFGPNPTFDYLGFGENVRTGRMNSTPNWADTRLHLDNVREIRATKVGETLTISPTPIQYAPGPGGPNDIGAHLCLFSSRGFLLSGEEIRFEFFPFEEGDCSRVPVEPWITHVGSSDVVLECGPAHP